MSDWRLFADRCTLETALATEVATRLAQGIAQRRRGYLVVSGGSTPLQLFSLLSETDIDWAKVVVLLADERWVDVRHDDSNERVWILCGADVPVEQHASEIVKAIFQNGDEARDALHTVFCYHSRRDNF